MKAQHKTELLTLSVRLFSPRFVGFARTFIETKLLS